MKHQKQTAAFAKVMAVELDNNVPQKGQFSDWHPTPAHVVREMKHHLKKLEAALKQGARASVTEYAADMANYAMKAHQVFGTK